MSSFIKPNRLNLIFLPIVFCLLICFSGTPQVVYAQRKLSDDHDNINKEQPPYPLSQIMTAFKTEKVTKDGQEIELSLEVRNKIVLAGVNGRGVAFLYTPEVEGQLKEAGATQTVLDTIRRSAAKLQGDEVKIHNVAVQYLDLGDTARTLKKYDVAIDNYDQAIELNTGFTPAYQNRGNTYKEIAVNFLTQKNYEEANKNYDKAIADYTKVIEIDSTNILGYYNRGLCYREKYANNNAETAIANFDKAIEDFKKNLELSPTDKRAHNKLVETYKYKGKPDLADAEIKRFEGLTTATINPNP